MDNIEREETLMRYMISDTHEKAPAGFTEKVMTRATLERVTRVIRYESPVSSRFFVVAGFVSAILLASALFLPGISLPESFVNDVNGLLTNIYRLLPNPEPVLSDKSLNIPAMFVYLSIALLMLLLFDRLLSSLFRRSNHGKN
jgi:hypothetical protein